MTISILLIDDEREFCIQAKNYLETLGYLITTEIDGRNAFDVVDKIEPDIIILDIDLKLDSLDGWIICNQLYEHPRYNSGDMGIILISGHFVAPVNEIRGLDIGADSYLTKPFEMEKLNARIKALQRRIAKSTDDLLQVDDQLKIDFKSRCVIAKNQEVRLTRLEFDLLAYLAQPPNTTRTKYDLFEKVWRRQSIEEGAIAKCISLIRKKISPDETDRYVKTVFGVGYLLSSTN